jgi:hypothetical protein
MSAIAVQGLADMQKSPDVISPNMTSGKCVAWQLIYAWIFLISAVCDCMATTTAEIHVQQGLGIWQQVGPGNCRALLTLASKQWLRTLDFVCYPCLHPLYDIPTLQASHVQSVSS